MEKYNWSLEKIYKNVDKARAEIKICDEIIEEIPLGRIGKTKDIIPAIKYIFESEYTTGETIKVTGGWYN